MQHRLYFLLLISVFFFLILMTPARFAEGQVEAPGEPQPHVVESAFVATFESEPADISANSFSLMLGGERFDFTFTTEGNGYFSQGFSHSDDQGEGNSGSILITSGQRNVDWTERIIISRNDGGLFIFSSIFINNAGEGWFVNVQGARNGSPVGDAQTMGLNSSGTLVFPDLLVDEVHLTSGDFYDTFMDSFSGSTTMAMDYGDLPESYGVTGEADDGARHAVGSLFLGDCVDAEADGQPSSGADGDDTASGSEMNGVCAQSGDDEDGLIPSTRWQNGADGGAVQATVTGGDGCLSGWIDWDGNGDFAGAGDHVLDMTPVSSGAQQVSFDVPDGTFSAGNPPVVFYARFRLTEKDSQAADCGEMSSLAISGAAGVGEVEDYEWSFSSTAVQLGQMRATGGREAGPLVLLIFVAGLFSLYSLRKVRRTGR